MLDLNQGLSIVDAAKLASAKPFDATGRVPGSAELLDTEVRDVGTGQDEWPSQGNPSQRGVVSTVVPPTVHTEPC